MPFLSELRSYLAAGIIKARGRRDFKAVLHDEVALDILQDAGAEQERVGRLAYAAQQADLEAARLIRDSLADGIITAEEIPVLRTALRHVAHSALSDHQITEILTPK